MPVIQVSIRDLTRLVGRTLESEELEHYILALKGEIESIEGDLLEYEATHDRPDLFSAEGLARAIKGLAKIEKGLRKFETFDSSVGVYVEGVPYRPFIGCSIVENVQLDEEAIRQLMQLQEKLHTTYCRNRRRASIGMYDLDVLTPPIYYRCVPKDQIRFVPLDMTEELSGEEILRKHPKGIEYAHILAGKKRYPLLVDSKGLVLSMPPIINSEDTRVTERTRNVFVDVTGTDLKTVLQVLTLMTTSIAERAPNGRIGVVEIIYPERRLKCPELGTESLLLEANYVNDILGLSLKTEEIKEYLEMMRFGVKIAANNKLEVQIPAYRVDILHPIDLVEEVAMAYGYENLEPELPEEHFTIGLPDPLEEFSKLVREIMAGLGYQEVANYMMSCRRLLVDLMLIKDANVVEVENPVSERYSALRNWLIPGLLQTLSSSRGRGYPQRIFEVGDVAIIDYNMDNCVREERHLAAAIAHPKATLVDALVSLNALMRTLGIQASYEESKHPSFIEGRFGNVLVDGEVIGFVGEVHPLVLSNFKLEVPVAAFEIDLSKLFEFYKKRVRERL